MLLSTDGLPGPVTMNRFGKPAHREAEVRARAVAPIVVQRRPPRPRMSIVEQRAGHRVEAGREDDGVDVVLGVAVRMPRGGDRLDRRASRRSTSVTLSRLKVSK